MQSDASNPFASAAADGFAAWWSGPRQAIHQWLQKHSPPLAELYLGANQLLCEPRPGWTRFVAHAMREIVNRLPAAICGEENVKGHLEYGQRVEAVAAILEKHGAGSGLVEPEIDTGGTGLVSVPMSLVTELDQLVQDHRDAGLELATALSPCCGLLRRNRKRRRHACVGLPVPGPTLELGQSRSYMTRRGLTMKETPPAPLQTRM